MTTCLRIMKPYIKKSVPNWTFTRSNRLSLAAALWCHQVDSFWTIRLINLQILSELEHLWPVCVRNRRCLMFDVWWILTIASLMLLEMVFSLSPTCDLRKFPRKAFMNYRNVGAYFSFSYLLRENKVLITSGWTFKILILFPKSVYLKRKKSCLSNMTYMSPMFSLDV